MYCKYSFIQAYLGTVSKLDVEQCECPSCYSRIPGIIWPFLPVELDTSLAAMSAMFEANPWLKVANGARWRSWIQTISRGLS